jgi:hypothetical protein
MILQTYDSILGKPGYSKASSLSSQANTARTINLSGPWMLSFIEEIPKVG